MTILTLQDISCFISQHVEIIKMDQRLYGDLILLLRTWKLKLSASVVIIFEEKQTEFTSVGT